ncbi:hypothetical protein HanRHA438_Chr12g0545161 [Helianthus annuus]|nr:hypothetical protein HanRHA438_Chr12g0545161 [Helianthus annuus]
MYLLHPSNLCPNKVYACNLLSGSIGAVGSIIVWHFTHVGTVDVPGFSEMELSYRLQKTKSV